MNFKFNNKIEKFLKLITKNAQEQNLRVFFVGGIVRDKILNIPTFDVDLLLLGNAIEFSKTLPSQIKIKSIHEDFCTVKLQLDELEIDLASSRSESYPYSGCLPIVDEIGVTIEKDALRRDFTINSLYCELKLKNNDLFYTLADYVDGLKDLENKTLKVLHNKSYIDDPTRIIRGLGFKYRFNFDFSEYDKELINQYLKNIDYSKMSHDRNLKVFKKVLDSKFQSEIFKEIVENKYYKIINKNDISIDFNLADKIFNIFCIDMVSMSELYLKILLNEEVTSFGTLSLLETYKIFSKMQEIDLAYYFYKTKDESVLKFLSIKDIKLQVNGRDLINSGYKQGKIFSAIFDDLLSKKLENPSLFKNKKDELTWILKNYPKN